MFEHEGVLRAALQASLQQWAQGRSTPLSIKDKRLERGNRKDILTMVTSPRNQNFRKKLLIK